MLVAARTELRRIVGVSKWHVLKALLAKLGALRTAMLGGTCRSWFTFIAYRRVSHRRAPRGKSER